MLQQPQPRHRKTDILTQQGFEKLQTATSKTEIWNYCTKSCTLEALSEQTGLSTHTLSKVHARKAGVDLRTLVRYFSAFDLTLEPSDYLFPIRHGEATQPSLAAPSDRVQVTELLPPNNGVSWGLAPDVSVFHGRTAELATLQQWVLDKRCRLIALLGMGGIGKTWLATKLAEQVQHEFKSVVWRSLRSITPHSPMPLSDFLDDLIRHLAPQANPTIPEPIGAKMWQLMDTLRRKPCLLVLDNVESILPGHTPQTASRNGSTEQHPAEDQRYRELLRQLGQGRHQSCVVLTSRMEPQALQWMSGENLGIRSLPILGLQLAEIQQMWSARRAFQGTPAEWHRLVDYYGGNPLILSIVATTIQCLFAGSITEFLRQDTMMFDEIREVLERQLEFLSVSEKDIMGVLATQDTPLSFSELRSNIAPSISTIVLLEALKFLKARSIVERTSANSCLQPLLRDYAINFYSHKAAA
ncbi:MAG: NACHT domain-containing protein [Microcoleus sp.]|uniref:NACHT domain-containing protein n=1 Tax=Microcoleus sp. TaxID=44472 RepID=UPI003C73FCFA